MEEQNPPKKPKTSGNEVPLPTNERLEKMIFELPITFPSVMIPVRIPELYHKMKNRQYPDYFYYSILALGNRLCSNTTTVEDKNLESEYAKKSLELLKHEKDTRNPFYLWACVILIAHYGCVSNYIAHRTLLGLSSLSVRISRIYQLDLSKITKMKYTGEEIEFRRRVFWSFYIFDRLNMSFAGSFPTIQDRDIVVNLPKNDFFWRYGGECKENHPELMLWNNIANTINIDDHPEEKHKNLVKTLLLHGKISLFTRRRWISKDHKQNYDNNCILRFIENLNEYKNNILIPNPVNFKRIKETHEKHENTLRMTIDIESQVLNYIFNQMHNSMKIVLFQSELVRVKGKHIRPKRIVSAKILISESAEKQIDMLHNLNQVLPPNHSELIASSWTLVSGVICLNLMGINQSGRKFDVPLKLKLLSDEYKKMNTKSYLFVVYPMFLNRLSKLVEETHDENKKYISLFDKMKKYSIDKSDVDPWLVSKYGSYFSVLCCFGKSFTILRINEYLDIDENIVSVINTTLDPGIENNTPNIISEEEHQNLLDNDEVAPGTLNSSKSINTSENYNTNYELYIKYSQLLEKSLPNSVNFYFFQRMVDTYSSKIVKDVLKNPINKKNNLGVSFNSYEIPISPRHLEIEKSYEVNYETYIKYSQLLEKSHPKSAENHFFKHMVDSYLNKVIGDILENPVNSRNNVETSFNIPDTRYNLNSFGKRVEDKDYVNEWGLR
ncbi:hypothetical protein BB558_002580 [Smittium angustum]|uniref:Xylanolytic transcriptional activator regulatory domain-containing protein n=1 Tax=Smittium angustum TaxID=133377 RepID=A0A2U1J8N5_SMIAN|nr:hypothetical protein BB558_002580 [Smittium angustum]